MDRTTVRLIVVLLVVCGSVAASAAGVPTLKLSASWDEQKLEKCVIHKTRVPRGGTFEVVATVDLPGVRFRRWDRPRITITASPELVPTKAFLDGKERNKADATVPLEKTAAKREIRWRYELPWQIRKAEPEYTFAVKVVLPRAHADLRKSITVEQGISCYDTTHAERLKMLAKSRYCKLESIGKSTFGREMYFLRVTDFTVPAAAKKKFVMIGAYHGGEVSGHGSILDFVYELITKKENERYLKTCALYIVPCMNPDGREAGWRNHPNGTDMNNVYAQDDVIAEGKNVAAVLQKYKRELTGAIGITTHQWGKSYVLLSHDCRKKWDWSDKLMKNVGIRISNEMDDYVHVQSHAPRHDRKVTAIRGYMFHKVGIPNFVIETTSGGYNVGRQMKSMIRELGVYYAVLDQLIAPHPVKPKIRPPKNITFPPEKNYQVYKVARPPKLDGKLDDACWQAKSIITNFKTSGRRPKQQAKTTVHVVYDDEHLYVAYRVPDLKVSKIRGHNPSPGVWTEDGADFMFDTNLNRWTYFQFQANANGAFGDAYWPIPGIPDSNTFNVTGYEVAGSVKNGAIEIKIPFAALNGHPEMLDPRIPSPPRPGTVWGVNFFRNKPSTSWAPMTRSAHAPWEYNAMTFTGKRK